MFYLITQILLCLLAAFLLGTIITWFFMRGARDRGARETEARTVASIGKLETELTAAREGMERYRDRAQALEKDLGSLRERMDELREKLGKDRGGAGDASHRVKELEAEVARLQQEANKSGEAARKNAIRAGELDAIVNSQKGRLASLEVEVAGLADLRRELDSVQAAVRERDERIAELERDGRTAARSVSGDAESKRQVGRLQSDVRDRDARVATLTAELRETREDYEKQLRQRDEEIARLRARHTGSAVSITSKTATATGGTTPERATQRTSKKGKQAEKKQQKPTAGETQRDDLKRIKGIGAVLERLLHQHGVHTFEQIASWKKEDIDQLDAKLGNFRGRIRRDHWVAQARKLAKK